VFRSKKSWRKSTLDLGFLVNIFEIQSITINSYQAIYILYSSNMHNYNLFSKPWCWASVTDFIWHVYKMEVILRNFYVCKFLLSNSVCISKKVISVAAWYTGGIKNTQSRLVNINCLWPKKWNFYVCINTFLTKAHQNLSKSAIHFDT
jgi:hypothetical protein